ncbi:MAG TPA: 5-(carboxyamino)imidazole ribonucleotide synthase [Actinobacteria bacterium]|nr:5-(carboxyamino)imidazole ribonucleotide synthase [Actinomycetota bacterium]
MSSTSPVDDFPTVGVIGGGQLARMAQQAAIGLGINLRVLAAAPKDSAALVINDVRVGNHDDARAVFAFADGVDVITFDHEHVPPSILRELQASGVAVRPGPDALIHAQDKVAMRRALTDAGLPCPGWAVIDADAQALEVRAQLEEFGERVGWPLMLKTSRGGYDGRGVWVADSVEAAVEIIEQNPLTAPAAWLLEERVDFRRELAAQIARSPHGQAVAYPVVETVQTDGICREVIAPAPDLDSDLAISAQSIALRVAEVVGVTGMLAVELFETADGLLINELAMRPHNSGHWSIDGAVTSQFENHLRAVLDLPLGSPAARAPYSVMVNVIGTDQDHLYSAYRHIMARDPHLKVHLYGKTPRRGRKLGHVTVTGDDLVSLRERAHHAADYLAGVIDE